MARTSTWRCTKCGGRNTSTKTEKSGTIPTTEPHSITSKAYKLATAKGTEDIAGLLRQDGTSCAFLNSGKKLNIGMKKLYEIECPCCGISIVSDYDICPICDWENDLRQLANPDYPGGANEMGLNEAKTALRQARGGEDCVESR